MTVAASWVSSSAAAIPEEARRGAEALWIVMVAVWSVALFKTRQTARRQTSGSRMWQMGIVLLGMWLLFVPATGIAWLDRAAFPVTPVVALIGLATTLGGIAFAIWARLILGANWSGVVTVKEGHTLVRRGPYRLVRHPIYTGLLTAVAGTALTHGSIRGILALPIVALGFWLKTLTEERFMVEEFGEEYLRYQREVRAVVPFVL